MSSKSIVKGLHGSVAGNIPAPDLVKLNFGELINLALGHTEDPLNYGSISFGLLRELLIALVEHLGVRHKLALQYDPEEPPACISTAASPLTSKELLKLSLIDSTVTRDAGAKSAKSSPAVKELAPDDVGGVSGQNIPQQSISFAISAAEEVLSTNLLPSEAPLTSVPRSGIPLTGVPPSSAESDKGYRDPEKSIEKRLDNLEKVVKMINKLGIETEQEQIGDPVPPTQMIANRQHISDVELRISNLEKGFDMMAEIIGKFKDRLMKMDKNITKLINEEENRKTREHTALEYKKSAREAAQIASPIEQISVQVSADVLPSATDTGRDAEAEVHSDHSLNESDHLTVEMVNEKLRIIGDSFVHPDGLIMSEKQIMEKVNKEISVVKELYQRLCKEQLTQDDAHLSLKKFVMEAFESVEQRLLTLASWEQLEKHITNDGKLPTVGYTLARIQRSATEANYKFAKESQQGSQLTLPSEPGSIGSGQSAVAHSQVQQETASAYSQGIQASPSGWGYVPAYGQNYYHTPHESQPITSVRPAVTSIETSGVRVPSEPPTAGPTIPLPNWQEHLEKAMKEDGESPHDGGRLGGPSDSLKETLESLGNLSHTQETMEELLGKISHNKADRQEVLDQYEFLLDYVRQLETTLKKQADLLTDFRQSIQHVDAQKVDREYMNFALSMKCDKKEVEGFIDKKYFDANTKGNEQALEELKLRVKQLERISDWRTVTDAMMAKINCKVNKEELAALNKTLRSMDNKLDELTQRTNIKLTSDEAVAYRKQLVPFNCLSCSRGLMLDGQTKPSSLPMEGSIAPVKSMKAYTSQEMNRIRDQFYDRDDMADIYSSPRPVGGAYTMVDPLRYIRNARSAAIQEEITTGQASAVAAAFNYPAVNVYNQMIVGNDGRMYKSGETTNEKLPDIHNKVPIPSPKSESPQQMRPPTATSVKTEPV